MEIYRTEWKITTIVFGLSFLLWVTGAYFEAVNTKVFIIASLGMGLLISAIVLAITVFSSVTISGTVLKFVYTIFIRRTIDIKSIIEIVDTSTYKVAKKQFRSLYIIYEDKTGEKKHIELRITIFPEKTLGRLIKDLKEMNPSITLSKYAENLMKSTV